jgi:hypothetical protein
MTVSPTPAFNSRRSPFDRVGWIALVWSAVFIIAAAGLTMLVG